MFEAYPGVKLSFEVGINRCDSGMGRGDSSIFYVQWKKSRERVSW